MDKEFGGRVALVTGGSRGIGRAICQRLAEAGAWIAVNFASNGEAANETVELIRAAGGEANAYKTDVSSFEAVCAMFDAIEEDRGPVDLLVANAGIASFKDSTDMPVSLWRETLSVNLDGTFHCVWRAKDKMRERNYGRIVCMSSINGVAPSEIRHDRLIAYGTAKSAVVGFSRNCAMAFGPAIRVNCIAPGLIDTDMTSGMSEEMRADIIARTPARRTGQPDDVAELAYFLLSDAASFITGQTIVTSGGLVTMP